MPTRPLRVLIVDDDPSLIDVLERGFSDAGLEVVAHTTFEGARQALRSDRFDALLTDVRLGAFNGLQLAVVARDTYPDIRIVVFSGFDDPVTFDRRQVVAGWLADHISSCAEPSFARLARRPIT